MDDSLNGQFLLFLCYASACDQKIGDVTLPYVINCLLVRHDGEVVLVALQDLVTDAQPRSVRRSIRLYF